MDEVFLHEAKEYRCVLRGLQQKALCILDGKMSKDFRNGIAWPDSMDDAFDLETASNEMQRIAGEVAREEGEVFYVERELNYFFADPRPRWYSYSLSLKAFTVLLMSSPTLAISRFA